MPRIWSVQYVDRLLAGKSYGDLVELSSAICSSPRFNVAQPDYRLPRVAFVFVETLIWFAQACRSVVWTYYEATPRDRQAAMAAALRSTAPVEFSIWYVRGTADWRDESKIAFVEKWMSDNDAFANCWMRALMVAHRDMVLELTA